MKHLFIAAMIAILIGTIQAIRIQAGNQRLGGFYETSCYLTGAHLVWSNGMFAKEGTEDVKAIIEAYRAKGVS